MKVSTKLVTIFIATGLIASLFASALVSRSLSQSISSQMVERETELVFGAIEAGPLAIARLQSSAISQQGLNGLMNNSALEYRSIRGVRIEGGPDAKFIYAQWSAKEPSRSECQTELVRSFSYSDALNPFKIVIIRDNCVVLPEETTIFRQSVIASVMVAVIAAILLIVSVWPVGVSLRLAEAFLDGSAKTTDNIRFTPILRLVDRARRNLKLEKEAALANLASQVAHDIRSPLSALNIFVATSKTISTEEKSFIGDVSKRINGIANNLLASGKAGQEVRAESSDLNEVQSATNVSRIVNSVFEEKRILLSANKGLNLQLDSRAEDIHMQVAIAGDDLARVISNLINNSAEAISGSGNIRVSLRGSATTVNITVQDDGHGIPAELLARLGAEKVSSKHQSELSGSGLGIWHAMSTIESAGGQLKIQSQVGVGTLIYISLPQV